MQFHTALMVSALGLSACCHAGSNSVGSSDVYARAIGQLGGRVVNAMSYPETIAGFARFLTDSGVTAISAAEMTRPNHPELAARLGFEQFLPPRSWWPRGTALSLLAQRIEAQIHAPVHVRNWWRPASYNADPGVGGAKAGDHPTANAVDLDYLTVSDRMAAERFLRALNRQSPWMQLSLGLGALTTHVGIASPRGHREWHYAGWQPAKGKLAVNAMSASNAAGL